MIRSGLPIKTVTTTVEAVDPLTSDIVHLKLKPEEPLEYKPGQYVDIAIPGADDEHRSFSMAGTSPDALEFMIKMYPGGRFSGLLQDGSIKPGDELAVTGPYGVFTLRSNSPRRLLFIGGGAGMAPILSLLRSLEEKGLEREATYYYGARTEADLFHLDELAALPGDVRRRAVGGQQRLVRRDRADHRSRRPLGGRHRRGRRLRLRPAADGRGGDRPARAPRASPRPTSISTSSRPPRTSEETVMATEVKERSVPKPVFTDAEAGAQEFPSWQSRSYNYFEPRKRRATVYEDVTIDVQPDPARHLTQGWVYAFANGDSGYPQEWTALKSSNWHVFLDPNEEWEQTIYRNNANVVRQISQNIEHGRTAHVFAGDEPRVGEGRRAPRVRLGARRARDRHARLHARPARRADEHDQQRDLRSARCTSSASRRT